MARRTRQSKTVVLSNRNRVTITVGSTQNGYYKTVTVKRPDGTGDTIQDERKAGLFGSGWFAMQQHASAAIGERPSGHGTWHAEESGVASTGRERIGKPSLARPSPLRFPLFAGVARR